MNKNSQIYWKESEVNWEESKVFLIMVYIYIYIIKINKVFVKYLECINNLINTFVCVNKFIFKKINMLDEW